LSVIAKSIKLLGFFSPEMPEIGLSQICRLAKRDKATTYRHLSSLEELGFVEQNPTTKAYRIGPAVLHLAEIREATVPRKDSALAPLKALADATGETAHVSILSGKTLHTLASRESTAHSTRAVIDIQTLPLHATASGVSVLAFGPPELVDAARAVLTRYTDHTAVTEGQLEQAVTRTRATGFGTCDRGLESDIYGLAAPVFDQTGLLAGSVAVACVASRATPDHRASIRSHLVRASHEITQNWGGTVPGPIRALWAATLSPTKERNQ
jgi:IclR family transcriptional regulator, KDG regulon repressor